MRDWLQPTLEALERGEAAMLVHVVELRGSGPRETGAQMLVIEDDSAGTIGGGELERAAMFKARELLPAGRAGLMRLFLGPQLCQCCGGQVTLAFEPFAPADLAWLKKLIHSAEGPHALYRTVRLDAAGNMRRGTAEGGERPDFTARWKDPSSVEIIERVNPPAPALWLFGAGHVGRALVPALHPLGFAITWIDGRDGQFPEPAIPGVKQLALAIPELAVDEAPSGTIFLVMTHSHPLDEAICEAVLKRGDFAYLGLIGSETKRASFVSRLREAGIAPEQLERLTCPIGLPNIASKEPTAIAASVAADLLVRRERSFVTAEHVGAHEH